MSREEHRAVSLEAFRYFFRKNMPKSPATVLAHRAAYWAASRGVDNWVSWKDPVLAALRAVLGERRADRLRSGGAG